MIAQKSNCIDFYTFLDQTHKCFLDLVEHELKLIDVTNLSAVQALIILNIGDNDVSLKDLSLKRGYSGSNASYNIKKMVANGYIKQSQSEHDKRSFILSLTDKGSNVFKKLKVSMDKHSKNFENIVADRVNYQRVLNFLREVSRTWRRTTNDW